MMQYEARAFRYDIGEIEGLGENNSHRMIIDFLGGLGPVLDVGCSTGFLGKYLKAHNIHAVGVEIDPVAAEQARPYYDNVVVGDIQSSEVLCQLQDGGFQGIVLGDVIEHLVEPWTFMKEIIKKAAEGASVIISIPNLGHASVIASLLSGDFDYQDMGLLDRTHLRFFGIKSLCGLVLDAGLTPINLKRVTYDTFGTEVPVNVDRLPPELITLLDRCPESHTYQFVMKTIKARPTEGIEDYVKRFSLPGREPSSDEENLARYLENLEKKRGELRDARQTIQQVRSECNQVLSELDQVASERNSLEETVIDLKGSLEQEKSAREMAENLFSIHGKDLRNLAEVEVREGMEARLKKIQEELKAKRKSPEAEIGCDISYDILIPIYNAHDHVKKCVESVLKHTKAIQKIYLLDDKSTDERILPLLRSYEERNERVKVLTSDKNSGFIYNINRGFEISRNDVVILNSDTEVTPLWLERMHRCRMSSPGVGIVSPLSNNATILSVPVMNTPNSLPRGMNPQSFAELVAECSIRAYRRIPTAVGFCMLVTRRVLDDVGVFDAEFGLGYGEECDFCIRAQEKGYEIVCCDDAYVHHYGEASFVSVDQIDERRRKNQQILHKRWPKYHADILHFCRTNPLRDVQERVHHAIMRRERGERPSVLHVMHNFNAPAGTELHTRNIVDRLSDRYHFTVLYPFSQPDLWSDASSKSQAAHLRVVKLVKENTKAEEYFTGFAGDLNSPMIEENFGRFLSGGEYEIVHFQHLADWATLTLPIIAKALGKKIVISLHDYYLLCPEYNLLLPNMQQRCGKQLADWNDPECLYCLGTKRFSAKRAPDTLNKYLAERAEFTKKIMTAADVLISPSQFVKNAFVKAFGAAIEQKCVVIPHGVEPLAKSPRPDRAKVLRVGFLGNATSRKGIHVFMDAVRTLKGRPVQFEIFGGTPPEIEKNLLSLGINVNGSYQRKDLPRLLRKIDLVAITSTWDETFCLTVSEAHSMGIPVIASNVGAISERVMEGVTGFLVPPGDASTLAKRLFLLAEDKRSLQMVIRNLSAHREKTIEENAEDYAKVYDFLLRGSSMECLASAKALNEETLFKQTVGQRDTVSMIILTFNQLKYTKECVESIRKYTPVPHEIIFVDNGSTDGTTKWLRELTRQHPHYKLIENRKNLGFSKGCNQGIAAAAGEYILLMNNDVVVTKNWLDGLLECLNSAPDTGIVGPMTNSISGPQQVAGDTYESMAGLDAYAQKFRETHRHRRVPLRRIVGFCMLFRRDLVDRIGMLDESFGTGNFEDDDFCLRAALDGYRNLVAGDVFVHHYGSVSFVGNKIDYRSTMSGNRRILERKWTLDSQSPLQKKFAVVEATERAARLYHKGLPDKAAEALINCIKIAPEAKEIYFELARLFLESKRFAEALEVVDSMPESAKDELKGLECAGYGKEGLGLDGEAELYADRMLALDPGYAPATNLKGVLAYKKGDERAAEDCFRRALDADPGYGEAHANLGVLRWAADRKTEAIEHLSKGFILSPTVPDHSTLYYSAVSSSCSYGETEKIFLDARGLYPNSKNIAFLYIDTLIQQGKFRSAMAEIEDAMVRFGIDDGILNAALSVREKTATRSSEEKSSSNAPLSLCMIAKNEEERLAKCLRSVRPVVDEMIVVDTGSTDRTKEIARAFGARVFSFPWTGDFAAARNFSLSKATGDWVLILDADEVISPLDYKALTEIVGGVPKSPVAHTIVTRNYLNEPRAAGWTPNQGEYPEESGTGWMPSSKVRLFTRDSRVAFADPVHETLEASLLSAKIPIKPCGLVVHHYGKLIRERDVEKGKRYYELGKEKLEKDPDNLKAVWELATQAQQLDLFEDGLRLWQKAINLSSDHPVGSFYFNLGYCLIMLERFEEAKEASQKAMALDPNIKEAALNCANCELLVGSLDRAMTLLKATLEKTPDYPPAVLLVAVIYCLQGKVLEMKELFKKLLQKGFNISNAVNRMAKMMFSRGKVDEALTLLNSAIQNRVSDQETLTLLESIQQQEDASSSNNSSSSAASLPT